MNIYIYIYKIEILLKPNLSVYMCETSSLRLEPWPLSHIGDVFATMAKNARLAQISL